MRGAWRLVLLVELILAVAGMSVHGARSAAVGMVKDLPSAAAAFAGFNDHADPPDDEHSLGDSRNSRHIIVDWRALNPFTNSEALEQPEEPLLPRKGIGSRSLQVLPVVVVACLVLAKAGELRHSNCGAASAARLTELLASLLLFLLSGPAVILLNKHIMKEYKFHFPILLSSLGNLLLMLATRGGTRLGCRSLANPTMAWGRYLCVVLLLSLFNFGTQVVGMWSYLFVSVPEIQILKSATVVLTMAFAIVLVKEPFSFTLSGSIAVIVAGAVITAIYDGGQARLEGFRAGAQAIGILLCLSASAFEAAKSVCSQILMDSLPVFDGLYWCSPVFVLLAAIFVSALELKDLMHFHFTAALLGCLVANAVLTSITVVASFWFVKLVGALSLKVVTQARTVGLILVSVLFFGEQCNDLQYVGCTATVIGMAMYDHSKKQLAQLKAVEPKLGGTS